VIGEDANDQTEVTRDFSGKTFGGIRSKPVEVWIRIGEPQITPQKTRNPILIRGTTHRIKELQP